MSSENFLSTSLIISATAFFLMVTAWGVRYNANEIKDKIDQRFIPIVKEYEDHSASIKVGDVYCSIPAFDSKGDRIKCSN
jgi:hypothetical protein